jgi:indole-3-glycerol phosphate synthase
VKIGFRHRRRGKLDKILTAKRAEAARMLAAPPHRAERAPGGGVIEALRRRQGEAPRWIADLSREHQEGASERDGKEERAGAGAGTGESEGEGAGAGERDSTAARKILAALSTDAAKRGAAAVWVPIDELFLGGRRADVLLCRDALDAGFGGRRPRIIAVDLIVDAAQLDRAAFAGADAALLIARMLAQPALVALISAAARRGLVPIVEAASEEDAQRGLEAGAEIIAATPLDRDTGRFDVDRARSALLAVAGRAVTLYLGGLGAAEDASLVAAMHIDAALAREPL